MLMQVSRANSRKPIRHFIHLTLALIAVCCVVKAAYAQASPGDIESPLRGFQPTASYSLSGIETINTDNGNLMLNIPLAALPSGRGGHPGFQLSLRYNSKIWNGEFDIVDDPINQNRTIPVVSLVTSEEGQGGWDYNLHGYGYYVEHRNSKGAPYPITDPRRWNIYKLKMIFPDGGVHEFRPHTHDDELNDGYYKVGPAPGMTYYSVDGTYARLDILSGGWVLYFPDGTRVVSMDGEPQRNYDRNGNYTSISKDLNYKNTGHVADIVTDQLGRSIAVERGTGEDYIHSTGVNGEPLTTTVKWGSTFVSKTYRAGNHFQFDVTWTDHAVRVVKEIVLPSQAGGLKYTFGYNGWPTEDTGQVSVGWGELSSVTLPSGARADYQYEMDNRSGGLIPTNWILDNAPKRKEVHYNLEYDGEVTAAPPEITNYAIGNGLAVITGPDGGVTTHWGSPSYKTQLPDGIVIERVWKENRPLLPEGVTISLNVKVNLYVERELTSIPDATGALVKTAIKDYSHDKNGNVTSVREYDWVAYGSVPHDAPVPSWVPLLREAAMTFYVATPAALDSATFDPDTYNQPTAPSLRTAAAVSQMRDSESVLSYAEFTYDSPTTTGNLLEQRSWDSTKGPLLGTPQDLVRLNAGNSISVWSEYDDNTTNPLQRFGNLTLAVDANGNRTKYTYGAVTGPDGATFTGLYPTTVVRAEGTGVQRTASSVYDFWTGLVRETTDEDNQISTVTTYDALGRPTLVEEADDQEDENGVSLERQTVREYSDALRRVIVRSDLDSTGDGKLVSVQHYDQLGRVRLSRKLEDASAPGAMEETAGIKVQTRYRIGSANSYLLVSNPYRAAVSSAAGGETTMGWTLTISDQGGRAVRAETFGGAGLPAPFAASDPNVSSTGAVTTAYDAEKVTTTDQAGRQRRSLSDPLGRLVKVFEAPNSPDYNYQTSYAYDVLGNLTQVEQGVQTRTFTYSSLSRLTSAINPEACVQEQTQCMPVPVTYEYDETGNLKKKTDARLLPNTQTHVQITYEYDELNRIKSRTYNDDTPDVAYFYDSQTLPSGAPTFSRGIAKGQLIAVTYGGGRLGSYTGGYDAMGRPGLSRQVTDTGTAEGVKTYEMSYDYHLDGRLKSGTYPSGKVVETQYDEMGRVAGVRNSVSGHYYAGAASNSADRIGYGVHGAVVQMRLGNGLWEHFNFNSRLQLTQIGLGSSATDSGKLRLDYAYGVVAGGTLDMTKNNDNLQSQTITVPGASAFVQTYLYDELNRLKSAEEKVGTTSTWKQVFSYDRYGNRNFAQGTTSPDYTGAPVNPPLDPVTGLPVDPVHNPFLDAANNRIKVTEPGQGDYRYDEVGNLLCEPGRLCTQGQAGLLSYYSYDAENKMKSAAGGYDNGGTSYTYNGDGRRVKKARYNGEITVFVYDVAGRVVAEYSNQVETKGTRYLTQDHLGSTRVVTDAQGNAHTDANTGAAGSRHDYLPFGEDLLAGTGGRAATPGYGAPDNVRQKLTGKERDPETGLDYFGARFYASPQGRFTSCDPISRTQGHLANPQRWNAYIFVINSPLTLYDPDGRNDKGKGGGRVIDVFIVFPNKDLRMNWRGLERMAERLRKEDKINVKVNLYSVDAGQVNDKRVERSLTTEGRYTVIVGHSFADPSHPSGKLGTGIEIGNGYLGTFGFTTAGPDGSGVDRELPTIKAAALMTFTCSPGPDFAPLMEGKLSSNSVVWYSTGGYDGGTAIPTLEEAGFEAVRALILGQTPTDAATAAQAVIERSNNPQDHNHDSMALITPRPPEEE